MYHKQKIFKSIKPVLSFNFYMKDHDEWLKYALDLASYEGLIEKALENFSNKLQILEILKSKDYSKEDLFNKIKNRLENLEFNDKEFLKSLILVLESNIKRDLLYVQTSQIKIFYQKSYPTIRKKFKLLRNLLDIPLPVKRSWKCLTEKDILNILKEE